MSKIIKPKIIRELPQVGKSNIPRDALINALRPGKRKSKNEKIYWETRKNRSDVKGMKV